ncbi:MFS transporter [Novosphingobium umbonatum]|uniref:MFS transporter n=1 Tax=Novosphingobium umbonatum TaxID=1908524 RepID=A0A3S2VE84_9SPHN|nr:MFS transporter [Novosphingobium umbonatum]RVU05873.1 MFS transporter [Novosphingobium umbonatum]
MPPAPPPTDPLENAISRKVILRIVVPAALYILIGAIDRTNVSFAALQMNKALGLSPTQYGFGAGVLFIGYMLAKYPSVLLFEALGLRRWLALITAAWGLCSAAMSTVSNDGQLYALRLAIGFAEGGLSSGLMLYLSLWATQRHRAAILAVPIMSINVAQVIGAPVSGLLLDWANPWGLAPWRMMFLAEALPALALAIFAWVWFPDQPEQARWLETDEKRWIAQNAHAAPPATPASQQRWAVLRSPAGWTCAAIWFCILASNYGIMFWLPQVVKGMGHLSASATGWIVALPNAASALGLLLNARHSDKTGERFLHIAIPALSGGVLLVCAWLLGPGLAGLLCLVLGGACTGCTVAAFWAIPTQMLAPASLPMGIVVINMAGSLAGATIPPLMGLLRQVTGSFLPPTLLLLGIAALCAGLSLLARRQMA